MTIECRTKGPPVPNKLPGIERESRRTIRNRNSGRSELTITSIRGAGLDDDVLALTGTTAVARRGIVAGSPPRSRAIRTACGPRGPARPSAINRCAQRTKLKTPIKLRLSDLRGTRARQRRKRERERERERERADTSVPLYLDRDISRFRRVSMLRFTATKGERVKVTRLW